MQCTVCTSLFKMKKKSFISCTAKYDHRRSDLSIGFNGNSMLQSESREMEDEMNGISMNSVT